jgi:hypothetical protein
VQETAQAVLATARKIVGGIEAELGIDLRPNPIADALTASQTKAVELSRPERVAVPGTADAVIFEHLASGDVDWVRLANSLPGCDHGDSLVHSLLGKPGGQAIVLAECGASANAAAAVLRAEGIEDLEIRRHLTVTRVDALGYVGPLYHPEEVKEALAAPRHAKALADELIADLLVSAGKHPAGAMHLAKTSGMPSNVINLVEERLRRRGHPELAPAKRRAERGLNLIDEWSGRGTEPPAPKAPAPEPPPPEPAA